jgi:hypothetical protein
MAAMTMVAIIGFVALSTDVGLLSSTRRRMQTAADAAAVAGLTALRNSASVASAANNVATLNGFTSGANSATVTVNNPPAGGLYAGNLNYVEVIIAQPEPTYFLRVLGYVSVNVSTRAVSGFGNGQACLYALDPSANNAVSITGGSSVTVSCGVLDDSNASQALVVSGGSALTAASIGVVGNFTGSGYSPAPKIGVVSVADPLAALHPPTVGSCTATNYTAPKPTGTIGPGTYCNGITVQGGANLQLNAGLYILNGGGLTVGGGSSITGTGGYLLQYRFQHLLL